VQQPPSPAGKILATSLFIRSVGLTVSRLGNKSATKQI